MTRTWGIGVLAVVLAAGVVEPGRAQQETVERVTVAFSDPARPGTLAVQLLQGSLTVRAADRRDVLIEARPRGQERAREEPHQPGTQHCPPVYRQNSRLARDRSTGTSAAPPAIPCGSVPGRNQRSIAPPAPG